MATSPTSRTLEALKAEGWLAQVVEKWNPHARVRQDLWGFVDVLAIRDDEVLAVQACAGASHAARRTKMAEHQNIGAVRKAGIRIELWSWRKSAKTKKWVCRREDLS